MYVAGPLPVSRDSSCNLKGSVETVYEEVAINVCDVFKMEECIKRTKQCAVCLDCRLATECAAHTCTHMAIESGRLHKKYDTMHCIQGMSLFAIAFARRFVTRSCMHMAVDEDC